MSRTKTMMITMTITMPSSPFKISRAKLEDKEAILELSGHFTEDYLEYTVDRWIEQEKGGLYLVWHNRLLVGCCSLYFPSPTEGWLQGMRVHPEYQGQGLAYALNRYLVEQAQKEGANALRLLTSPENHPAFQVTRKLGFSPKGSRREIIFRVEIKTGKFDNYPNPTRSTALHLCKTSELSRAAYFLDKGPLYHGLQGFLLVPGYSCRRLTISDLEKGVKKDQVYLLEKQGQERGLLFTLPNIEEGHLILSYFDAPLEDHASLLSLFKTWFEKGYHLFTISLLKEQHQVLKPDLEKIFENYEFEQLILMEKTL